MRRVVRAVGICGVACLALLAAAGPLYRVGLPLPAAFALLRWAAYGGAAVTVVAAALAWWSHRNQRRWDVALLTATAVIGFVTAAVPYSWMRSATQVPPIHDITTDLLDPPQFVAVVPLRADATNRLERTRDLDELQKQGYPDIQPVTLAVAPAQAFDRVLRVAQDLGWSVVATDSATGLVEATDTTRWFGFVDDIVIRLTAWGSGTRVDVRSVSRVGRSDAGTNARRIRDFLARVQSL